MGIKEQRNEALTEFQKIQAALRDSLVEYFEKFSKEELNLLIDYLTSKEIRGPYLLYTSSDGGTDESELAQSYFTTDTDVLTCPFDEVPLFIRTVTKDSKRNDRMIHAAAAWRLKIGK